MTIRTEAQLRLACIKCEKENDELRAELTEMFDLILSERQDTANWVHDLQDRLRFWQANDGELRAELTEMYDTLLRMSPDWEYLAELRYSEGL